MKRFGVIFLKKLTSTTRTAERCKWVEMKELKERTGRGQSPERKEEQSETSKKQ